jgi:hypothetical protein
LSTCLFGIPEIDGVGEIEAAERAQGASDDGERILFCRFDGHRTADRVDRGGRGTATEMDDEFGETRRAIHVPD